MLQMQLNPHFLFNSLNVLSSLVYEDADKSALFIRKLSDVYRYVLENRERDLTHLSNELDFTRSYTFLLSIRFQDMINFDIDIEEHLFEWGIAPMTIQLLIENAVKHNIASSKDKLSIRLYSDKGWLIVENNIQKKESVEGSGMGLKNISNRYGFLTKKPVDIYEDKEVFRVKIPLLEHYEDNNHRR
jgi:LytS/YehU family sensor histidine kinase